MQNKKIQLWALSMIGYNCRIEYIAGKTNTCVDLLSRKPDDADKGQEDLTESSTMMIMVTWVYKRLLTAFDRNIFGQIYSKKYISISSCTTCQTRSLQKIRQPLQETDILPYPMAKVSLDLSGPYPTTLSGNKYIIAFVDWFSGWP